MPIRNPEPPEASVVNVKQSLVDLLARTPRDRFDATAEARPPWSVTAPHEIYVLSLEDIQAGGALDEARSVGWGYLVSEAGEIVAAAETAHETATDAHGFTQLKRGRTGAAIADAINTIEKSDAASEGQFELRLLRAPAVYSINLWLHNASTPNRDILMPVDPTPAGIIANNFYQPDDLLNILRKAATATDRDELSGG